MSSKFPNSAHVAQALRRRNKGNVEELGKNFLTKPNELANDNFSAWRDSFMKTSLSEKNDVETN